VKRSAISWRHPLADSRCRRGRKCGEMRLNAEISDQHASEWAAISEVARLLGVGCAETVRKWVRQGQVDSGSRAGTTTEESAELKRLKRENAELRRANVILGRFGRLAA